MPSRGSRETPAPEATSATMLASSYASAAMVGVMPARRHASSVAPRHGDPAPLTTQGRSPAAASGRGRRPAGRQQQVQRVPEQPVVLQARVPPVRLVAVLLDDRDVDVAEGQFAQGVVVLGLHHPAQRHGAGARQRGDEVHQRGGERRDAHASRSALAAVRADCRPASIASRTA